MQERTITDEWTEEKREKALQFLKNQRTILSEAEYRQEYLAEFLDENRQWFEDSLILRQMKRTETIIQKQEGLYMGVDIAGEGEDDTVFTIVKHTDTKVYHLQSIIEKKTGMISDLVQKLKLFYKLYNLEKIFIDCVGMGHWVLKECLNDSDLRTVVIGIDFSKEVIDNEGHEKKLEKNMRYSILRGLLETDRLELLDDTNVFHSLKSIQAVYTNDSRGTRRLHIFGSYDHIADSLTYACACIEYKHFNNRIYSIRV